MDEIRRTIMNEFADETCCDMFIMVLKQKWPEFVLSRPNFSWNNHSQRLL